MSTEVKKMNAKRVSATLLLPLLFLLGFSPAALAGSNIIVNLGAEVSAEPVPVLGSGLWIALGLLLGVVAFRFFKANQGARSALCVAVIAGGGLLAAWGAEKSVAGGLLLVVPVEDPICTRGGTYAVDTGSTIAFGWPLQNQCESTPLTVLSYENLSCGSLNLRVVDADVGDVIPPGVTVTINHCGL